MHEEFEDHCSEVQKLKHERDLALGLLRVFLDFLGMQSKPKKISEIYNKEAYDNALRSLIALEARTKDINLTDGFLGETLRDFRGFIEYIIDVDKKVNEFNKKHNPDQQ